MGRQADGALEPADETAQGITAHRAFAGQQVGRLRGVSSGTLRFCANSPRTVEFSSRRFRQRHSIPQNFRCRLRQSVVSPSAIEWRRSGVVHQHRALEHWVSELDYVGKPCLVTPTFIPFGFRGHQNISRAGCTKTLPIATSRPQPLLAATRTFPSELLAHSVTTLHSFPTSLTGFTGLFSLQGSDKEKEEHSCSQHHYFSALWWRILNSELTWLEAGWTQYHAGWKNGFHSGRIKRHGTILEHSL